MVNIQSPTAEIRRGKKEEERRRRKKQDENIMVCPITYRATIIKIETTAAKYNVRICYAGRP